MPVIFIDSIPKSAKATAYDVEAFGEIEFSGSVDDPDIVFAPGYAGAGIQFEGSVTLFPIAGAILEFAGSAQSTDWFGGATAEISFGGSAAGFIGVFFGGAGAGIQFEGYADGIANNLESYLIQVIVDVVDDDWGDPFND